MDNPKVYNLGWNLSPNFFLVIFCFVFQAREKSKEARLLKEAEKQEKLEKARAEALKEEEAKNSQRQAKQAEILAGLWRF